MNPAYQQLVALLREARSLLALPGNNFDWSSWGDLHVTLHEVDGLIAESNQIRCRLDFLFRSCLVQPAIQEVSISSGWANEFLDLASRFDQAEHQAYYAEHQAYYQATWWQRLLNWRVGRA